MVLRLRGGMMDISSGREGDGSVLVVGVDLAAANVYCAECRCFGCGEHGAGGAGGGGGEKRRSSKRISKRKREQDA